MKLLAEMALCATFAALCILYAYQSDYVTSAICYAASLTCAVSFLYRLLVR